MINEISSEFESAILYGGTSYVQECCCGIMHFCDEKLNPQAWYEDDDDTRYYEKLLKRSEKDDKKYIYHSESIAYAEISNEAIVIGCPCKKDVRYEQWIWSNKAMISKYLNARIMRELQDKMNEFPETVIAPSHDLLERIEQVMFNAQESFKKLIE